MNARFLALLQILQNRIHFGIMRIPVLICPSYGFGILKKFLIGFCSGQVDFFGQQGNLIVPFFAI